MLIWSLSPLLAQTSIKILNFLSDKNNKSVFCYVNEVAFGKSLRMRAGCQWIQSCDYRVGTFNPIPLTFRERERLEIESTPNGQ